MKITREDLIESPVRFDEASHTYTLEDKRLSGITSLIHQILGLGIYPEADGYTKGYLIPRAGSRGTAVHHAIQTYDELGIKAPEQTVPTRYYKGEPKEHVEEEDWDVSFELEQYIKHLEYGGFTAVANEYTVSDGRHYASQIDNVWQHEDGSVWLVDTKTNNTGLYPVCGYFNTRYFRNGVEALKEYLSWQLSVYAWLFERQNPGIKVDGLACNWLRKDEAEFWIIKRKPDNLVEELLKTEAIETYGGWIYYHPEPELFGITKQLEKAPETLPILPEDIILYMDGIHAKMEEYKAKYDECKKGLRKAMETHGVDRCDLGRFKATLSADTTAKTFDTARFKKENPELYAKYIVEKEKKGSLIIKYIEDDKD